MNVGVFPDGRVETGDNPSKPGDCVVFKAWEDSVVALSACPQEFNPVGRLVSDRPACRHLRGNMNAHWRTPT